MNLILQALRLRLHTKKLNYNKPKSENSRQPGYPEEKVKAIEDALRHFQMI
ncbi:MAG: RNA methyltransferase [Clostridium butyricum]|nr:RNA methyltransferase [Clostridium butyricum]